MIFGRFCHVNHEPIVSLRFLELSVPKINTESRIVMLVFLLASRVAAVCAPTSAWRLSPLSSKALVATLLQPFSQARDPYLPEWSTREVIEQGLASTPDLLVVRGLDEAASLDLLRAALGDDANDACETQVVAVKADRAASDGQHWRTGDIVLRRVEEHKTNTDNLWRVKVQQRAAEGGAPAPNIVLSVEDLVEAGAQALRAAGEVQADAVARFFIEADIEGKSAHGARRLLEICDALDRGDVRGAPEPTVTVNGATIHVDGDGGLAPGVWASPDLDLTSVVSDTVRKNGVACVRLTNTRSVSGRLASIVKPLADAGLVAVATANTPAYLAVPSADGAQPAKNVLGTNPVALAAPLGPDTSPVVIDLSLAGVSRGALETYAADGKSIPLGLGLDASGAPTVDPLDILERGGAQLPIAGLKGAVLAAAVELLAGGLTDSDLALDSGNYHTMNRGMLLLAFQPPDSFETRAFDFLTAALPHIPGARKHPPSSTHKKDVSVAVAAETYFSLLEKARKA